MGSAILRLGSISRKVAWRGDLETMARTGAAMWLAATAGGPVPSASREGSAEARESGLKSPIVVSC